MQATPQIFALLAVIFGGLVAGAWCWLIAAARAAMAGGIVPRDAAPGIAEALRQVGVSPGLPLVAWSPRRTAPWALFDLAMLLGIWIAIQLAIGPLLREFGWKLGGDMAKLTLAQRQAFMLANIGLSLGILAIGLPLIALRTGARPRDFGWSWPDLPGDVRLGLIGLAMLAPPVYALQAVLVSIWKPSSHPMIEMFKDSPDGSFFLVLFVAAALVAPLFEELIFRVLLQGFLERVFTHQGPLWELLLLPAQSPAFVSTAMAPEDAGKPLNAESTSFEAVARDLPHADVSFDPYSPIHVLKADDLKPLLEGDQQPELRGPPAWCAIAISSLIFALLHWNHGPDWVPLTLLAAGMGYLYQRTHRLVPSLIVHFGLNSLSMWMLWVHIYQGLGK